MSRATCDGSVIVIHVPDRPSRRQALTIIRDSVTALRERGLTFVRLTELFAPDSSLDSACSVCGVCIAFFLLCPCFFVGVSLMCCRYLCTCRYSNFASVRDASPAQGGQSWFVENKLWCVEATDADHDGKIAVMPREGLPVLPVSVSSPMQHVYGVDMKRQGDVQKESIATCVSQITGNFRCYDRRCWLL